MANTPGVAVVGTMLSTAMKYAVPNVTQQFPGQGADFMGLIMEHLEGMGVPGAAGLKPNTQAVAMDSSPSTADFAALYSVGSKDTGPAGGRSA